MPNISCGDVLSKMPKYLDGLKDCRPFNRDEEGNLRCNGESHKPLPKTKGVYCFYEGDKALYVGRTNNIRKRVLQHCRPRGRHNSAAFAFKIAKKNFEEKNSGKKLSRAELAKDPVFDRLFTEAKMRVRAMSVHFVEIQDSNEQAIFEVYAHIKLETPFNDFDNH